MAASIANSSPPPRFAASTSCLILQDSPKTSILANAGAELLLEGLFVVVVATVVAAFAIFLVRLIGRGVAWMKLRF